MSVSSLLLISALVAYREPPPEEVTVRKEAALSESMQMIDQLIAVLENLDDPRVREDSETVEQHYLRAERILKTRALLLIKVGEQYESALLQRFTLEADLEQYKDWVDATRIRQQLQQEKYQEQKVALRKQIFDLQREGTVLSHMFCEAARSQVRDLTAEGKAAAAERLEKEIAHYEPAAKRLPDVFDSEQYLRKYETAPLEALRENLDTCANKLEDAKFHQRYLEVNVLGEFAGLQDILNESHIAAIRQAEESIQKSEYLEQRAAEVAIMSEYMADILQDIDVRGTLRRVKIKSRFPDEEKLAASLEKLQGESFEVPGDRRSDLFDFTRTQPRPSEKTPAENSEDAASSGDTAAKPDTSEGGN